jgi:glycerate 2-kinase
MVKIPQIKKKWVKDINTILSRSLASVDPFLCVSKYINLNGNRLTIAQTKIDLETIENIYIIGIGKAAISMAKAVVEKIGDNISGGIIISKSQGDGIEKLVEKGLEIHLGSHPIPDKRSLECAVSLEKFVENINSNDLIITLISGGGSALMTLPYGGITLDDIKVLTDILLMSGATIQEINTIRKHIDRIKGGGLAKMAFPAKMVTLILSDVVSDEISMIASGPTTYDETSFFDALIIIRKFDIEEIMPENILNHIKKGVNGEVNETIKQGDKYVQNISNTIIGSISSVVKTAEDTARNLGYTTLVNSKKIIGEASEVGREESSKFINMYKNDQNMKPVCFIAGGETTVTVSGKGKGGRNQELALGAIEQFENYDNCCLISLATDGEDGPTDAAGAFVTGASMRIAREKGLDPKKYLENNDSYSFFNKIEGLIRIGSTGTNVNDLLLMLAFE